MAKTIRRRRHEGKTDYKARLALLKSEKPRLIVRKTNKYIIAQIVETEIAQDKIILGLSSKALLKKTWPENLKGSLKSLAAAYLTGFILGNLAKDKVNFGIPCDIYSEGSDQHRGWFQSSLLSSMILNKKARKYNA